MAPLLQDFVFRGARSDNNDTSGFIQTADKAGNYITSHPWVSWLYIIAMRTCTMALWVYSRWLYGKAS